jgi:TRAP-type C4-dicarboxylate transport system permease small subunit
VNAGSESARPVADDRLAGIASAALAIAGIALVLLALVELWQVIARYVFNDSPSWTEPVAILCMNTTMMLGAAAGVHAQRHFGFFVAVHAATPWLRRLLVALSRAVQAAVGLMLAGWGLYLAVQTWDVRLAGIVLPQGASYLPLCGGGALIALFAADLLLRAPDLRREGG